MIRRKGDSLPPRHLPVSGGKKRSSNDAGLLDTDRKSSKKMKCSPNKKPLAPPAKQGNAQRQPGQSQQKQQQQSNAQNNKKKNGQNNKKAQQHSDNKSQQDGQPLTSNVSGNNTGAQGKGNKNNKANTASNTNSNAKSNTNNKTQISKGPKNNSPATRMPDHCVNEKRKVRFTPESASQRKKAATTETSSDGDSSDSDSSDSESSSSSSSESSDSNNNDSDSSDESTSGSKSNKSETKAVITRVIPGKGKGATKSRNARRKVLKQKMAEVREEADAGSNSDTSASNPLKRDYKAGTRPVDSTPTTSGKAAKIAAPQVNGKDSAQDNKKKATAPQVNGKATAPQANGKATAQASAPPKVIMTSVDLKDSELVTKSNPKRVTRSSQKKPSGVTQEAPATPQPGILRQKNSQNNKTVAAEKGADDTSEVDTTPRDYNSLPKSEDNLTVGDVIAFKV